ncbi:MAG: aminotransferase class I/II-fold pyridoxal phosphate-dependent enzyme [Bdellovibrionaceae bacterium]|nr:aminotransferase class I/II-fold pyridoxal phosphate-dependent enzyme [Pseudobdellovibrionaceae bacterium]
MSEVKKCERVLLSCPHMGGGELDFVSEAFSTNWVAPLGPNVTGFEDDIAQYVQKDFAVAMSSGTSAIHIALKLLGVEKDDFVFVSSLTFVGSANPVLYEKAEPVFIDSEPDTWNMSPSALASALKWAKKKNKLPKAIIVVDLFGMPAKYEELIKLSDEYKVPIIEDAAESLGSRYNNKMCGSFGVLGIFSFNGNKIITTGGGGMLVCDSRQFASKALHLITQARDPAPYYQHSEVGYNYRMSNVLAGIGRGQMQILSDRIEKRRKIFNLYHEQLGQSGLIFLPESKGCYSNRWLSTACISKNDKRSPIELISFLNENNIESRPVWKPMHMQPLFKDCKFFAHNEEDKSKNSTSEYLFAKGICLPSSTNYKNETYQYVADKIKQWLV